MTDAAPLPPPPPSSARAPSPLRGPASGTPAPRARPGAAHAPLAASPTTEAQRRWGVRVLLLTAFTFGLGQTVLFAVLPPIAREAGLSEFQVTMIFGCSAVFWVLTSPRWGRRSDAVGRKPVVLIGLVAFVLAMLALAGVIAVVASGALTAAAAFGVMTVTRCFHGAIGSAGPAASQAYIADRSSAEDRTSAMAGFAAAFGIGTTAGPSLGALGTLMGPVGPLVLVAVVGAVAGVLIWRFVPEATPPKDREIPAKLSPLDPRVRRVLAYGLLSGIVTAMQLQFLSFYTIDTLGLTPAEGTAVGGAALTVGAAASLFSQVVLVRRLKPSPRRMMRVAPALVAAGFVVLILAQSFAVLSVGLVLSGLGLGMSYPAFNAAASLAVGPADQGGAAGLAAAAGASGFIVAPVIGSVLYGVDRMGPFALGIVVCGVMAVIAWWRSPLAKERRGAPA